MPYNLPQAAAAVSRDRSTILRAIRAGKLSATSDAATGGWLIEPAELHRLYPAQPDVQQRNADATAVLENKGPGPLIRRLFGPYEQAIAEAYRRIFVDLDDFVGRVRAWVPQPRRILEVGCGEGAFAERLAKAFPEATITAIDITPRIGRLYRGDPSRVMFLKQPIHEVAEREPASYDLVVLCDILHHVPLRERDVVLDAVGRAMVSDGHLVVKD